MSIDIPYFSESEPDTIKKNSDEIKRILSSEDLNAELLQEQIELREKIILKFLDDEPQTEKALIQDLLRTNQELTHLVGTLKSEQQKVLVSFLRTRKAVKKYQ